MTILSKDYLCIAPCMRGFGYSTNVSDDEGIWG